MRDRASYIPQLPAALTASNRLVLVPPIHQTIPVLPTGISFHHSDGHTPGMLLTQLKGMHHTLLFGGDLFPGRHWVHVPIVTGYDRFAEKSVEEKDILLKHALDEKWIIFYPHDPDVVASSIGQNEKGHYVPLEPMVRMKKFIL